MVEVRIAQPDDVGAVRQLVERAYGHYVERMGRPPRPMLADYDELVRRGVVHVTEVDGQLASVLVAWPEADHLYVDNLAVEPSAQGRGLGLGMLTEAEEWARTMGLAEIRLCTNALMTENLAFYARHGFTETHREVVDVGTRVWFCRPVSPPMPAILCGVASSAPVVVERSVVIAATREQVFDLLADDTRFFELRPHAVAHRDIEPLPNGGHACTQEYEIKGRRFTQRCVAVTFERPARVVDRVTSDMTEATVTATFEQVGDGSRLTIRQQLVAKRRMGVVQRWTTRRRSGRQLTTRLSRIKDVAEARR